MRRPILSLLACLLSLSLGCIEDNTSSPDNPEPEPQPSAEPSPPEPSPPEPSPPEPDVMPEPTPPEPEPAVRVPINHRAAAAECDDERRPGSTPDFDGPPAECFSDEDCPGDNNGRCTGNSHDGWYCTYDACFADADCDGVCECGGGFRSDHNVCLGGDCRIDADCGPGGYCSPSFGDCGAYLGVVAYYCHTAEDECVDDADCGGDPQFGFDPYCAYNPGVGHWTCAESHCAGK